MDDPYVFRNILLIAGLHYAWNVGNLSSFDSTFLFHKVQSIRTINTWIENRTSSSLTLCVRHIATLCVVECCLGNFSTAETHLDGLMLLLDSKEAYGTIPSTPKEDLDEEFTERYLIMAFNLVHSLKSRFDDFVISTLNPTLYSRHMDPKEIAHLIHQWHTQEVTGILPRLRAMNLFPSFLSPISPEVQIKKIDVQPILGCMQEITDAFELRYSELYYGTGCALPYHLWASGGPSKLLSAVIGAHISSITAHTNENLRSSEGIKSSWTGICVAVGLYLTSVLGVWNQGYPAENRLLHHILRILRHDLEDSLAEVMINGTAAQDLWLWKAFLGALSLAHVVTAAGVGVCDARLWNLVPDFNHYIQIWAGTTRISMWQNARHRLENIVFPTHFQREGLAKELWNRALSAS
ncbi:hypothetical protein UA08_08213 [Talaromyces atroroseus]|uniref:Transcription factor domain-containing protein n=1 Tax=Talaromyces atroroseus TaxID=1441469 RepID=A0A225AT36_TALAT|nr:hypothetical protein UA08_08213 [Talaromyces atroroseus]OKL56627.1 hypothetical protein UA08_08213 [Talaromyces atroroseus]